MCGRFTLQTLPSQWGQLLLPLLEHWEPPAGWTPRYNIAPTQNILAILAGERPGRSTLDQLRWGLIPSWSQDLAIGSRMINARAETLLEKRSFAGPLAERRCMILADGYYEWQKQADGRKQPCWLAPAAGGPMLLAGLWEVNRRATGVPIRSCTLITTAANHALSEVHDRMPVVLHPAEAERWIDPRCKAQEASELLQPAADDFFRIRKVSTRVNNVRHDDPECLAAGASA